MNSLPSTAIEMLQPEELVGFSDDFNLASRIISLLYTSLNFSDIYVHEGKPLMVRLPRGVFGVSQQITTREDMVSLFSKLEKNWESLIANGAFDRSLDFEAARIRANCFTMNHRSQLGMVIRRFPAQPLPLSSLGLTLYGEAFANLDRGLVLVIGDMGQGKSTTLASMLDYINMNRSGHILTIEDPIETIIPMRRCLVTQREVGPTGDCESFFVGAKDAMREKTDVVMIGEIRDEPTAVEALAVAESGPLVLASLHARSPEQGIMKYARLLGATAAQAEALGHALKGVVYQSLLPSLSGETYHLASEAVTINAELSKAIANQEFGKIRSIIEKSPGCNTMNSELLRLIKEKKIAPREAERASTDREKLRMELRAMNLL
jgi:twitching motility protein PilT